MEKRLLVPLLCAVALAAACRPDAEEIAARAPSSATFQAAVDAVLPSVVFIQVEARQAAAPGLLPFGPTPQPEKPRRKGAGSGFIFTDDGYILTSNHVVQEAARVMVTSYGQRQFEAQVVARDPSTDVAVVKIDGENLPVAPLGNSEALERGDWVLALGSPLGLLFTATAGIVSAEGRSPGILGQGGDGQREAAPLEHFIQTDAAINPGNSGGPLVNLAGKVVGINTAILSPTGLFTGYGFAIPIDLARRVARDLIAYGEVRRAFLGVLLEDVTPPDARVYGLEASEGAEVIHVQEGSPAANAGLRIGDVIYGVDEQPVRTLSDLQAVLAATEPGTTAALRVARYGERLTVPVKLGIVRSGIVPERPPIPSEPARLGFAVSQQGNRVVVAAVQPYTAAGRAGVRPGQVVAAVNRHKITSVEQFAQAARAVDGDVISLILVDPNVGRIIVNYELRP